jgi:hypothetical protein
MKQLTLFFMFCFALIEVEAQINSVQLEVTTVPNNDPYAEVGTDGIPLPYHVAMVTVEFAEIQTTDNPVVKLHAKLGSSAGAANLKNKTFELGLAGISEDGSSIALQDNKAYIVFGSFIHEGSYYAEVKAEMFDGSFGEVYESSGP